MDTKKTITINDVARMAGVSKRTVSRVINQSDKVGEKTREKIQRIIEESNFLPNTQARGLASKRSYLIGMLYGAPTLFINEAQKGVASICTKLGYDIVVHPCEVNSDSLLKDVEHFVRRSRVDGLLIMPPVSQHPALPDMLREIGCHYVRFTSDENVDKAESLVVASYDEVMQDVADHLVNFGHSKFAYIGGPANNIASQKRFASFSNALVKHDKQVPEQWRFNGEHTYDNAYKIAKDLLSNNDRPTAVFAFNDEMAIAVVKAAKELNIEVPTDLSVIGFDGTWFASHFAPSISTVERPVHDMSALATRKLFALIDHNGQPDAEQQLFIVQTFVPGESSGPCPT